MIGVSVSGMFAESPPKIGKTAEAGAIEKFAFGAFTSKLRGFVYVAPPLVPVILSAYVPAGARLLALIVSVDVPAPVTVAGLKL